MNQHINLNTLLEKISNLRKRIEILQIKLNAFNQSLDFLVAEDELLSKIK